MSDSARIFMKHYDQSSQRKLDADDKFFSETVDLSDDPSDYGEQKKKKHSYCAEEDGIFCLSKFGVKKSSDKSKTSAPVPQMKTVNTKFVIPKLSAKASNRENTDENSDEKKNIETCLHKFKTRSKLSSNYNNSSNNKSSSTINVSSSSSSSTASSQQDWVMPKNQANFD